MARNALPCVSCGRELENVHDDALNQPHGGTTFTSEGHYGSGAFDPMDNTYIEINICDPCLLGARDDDIVLYGMRHKRVICDGVLVGWTKVHRESLPWTGREPSEDALNIGENALNVDVEDVGNSKLYPEILWTSFSVEWARQVLDADNALDTITLPKVDAIDWLTEAYKAINSVYGSNDDEHDQLVSMMDTIAQALGDAAPDNSYEDD